jgi:ribose 5-phosphate isomerase B
MAGITVYMGSDHAGFHLKKFLREHLESKGHTVADLGTDDLQSCDYPVYARKVGEAVVKDGEALGILICGSGAGMSMTANRIPGIRAALCTNEYLARMTRLHNNANVLCLGERVTGPGLAASIAEIFLETSFEGGRHQRRIDLMDTGGQA